MKILYFASAAAATGCAEENVTLDEPTSLEEMWGRLCERHPGLAALRAGARLSCNDAYADDETRFRDADVVAVIPPVSGG